MYQAQGNNIHIAPLHSHQISNDLREIEGWYDSGTRQCCTSVLSHYEYFSRVSVHRERSDKWIKPTEAI